VGRLELWIRALCCDLAVTSFFLFFFGDRGIVHPRQMMKVPKEPSLSPNNGLCKRSVQGKQSPQRASKTSKLLLETGLWSSVCGIWQGILNRSNKENLAQQKSLVLALTWRHIYELHHALPTLVLQA